MKKNKHISEYEKAVNKLTKYFVKRYFDSPTDVDWVGDEVAGVLHVNDYFFGFDDIVNFIKYDYSEDDLFKYYDYCLEVHNDSEMPINIRQWRELK